MAVVMLKQMLPIDDRVINDFTARVDGVHVMEKFTSVQSTDRTLSVCVDGCKERVAV